jgi:hypothetical protein
MIASIPLRAIYCSVGVASGPGRGAERRKTGRDG